jgi:DMSO/TMAO reductase YedYZ heme-binding membrane subunit
VAFYLLLVVWGSSLFRSRLSYSLWRRLHPLALLALVLVALHALYAGTDGMRAWLIWSLAACGGMVGLLCVLWWRMKKAPPARRNQQRHKGALPNQRTSAAAGIQRRPSKALSK